MESFGSVDGPGVRYVVFMQGCNMRCKYCHNPETWACSGGDEYLPDELFDKVIKYRSYWGKGSETGGVTVSGGEPLLQIDFVTAFLSLLKEQGVHTAIDTSGQPFTRDDAFLDSFDKLLQYTDLFILDIKLADESGHKELTGFTNSNILDMAQYLSDKGVPMWIRYVLVPGITDDESDLRKAAEFIRTLKTVERIEVLPYHSLGVPKWHSMGLKYSLESVSAPTKEELSFAEEIFKL